ncbi:alpha/beta fold hydrolase [Methanoregula sp.]|uniref:alpha/beta fold hydrolase n=1 Tax=Methanoregula sp. TaxID=2052170 RepID=UPI00356A310F
MTGLPETGVKHLDVNGISLAYREIGSGYPLLLINGFASAMDTWSPPLLELLAQKFCVIIFDNRGTGFSTASEEPFSISLFTQDTAALMYACGIDRAHILGLSMGASIAQEMILTHPERVNRLILVAGTCGGGEAVRMRPDTWETLTDKSGTPAELADRMFSLLFTGKWLAAHDPWKYCPEVHETTGEEMAARQAEAFFSWTGSAHRLAGIRNPTLVITGTEDIVIPPANADVLADRIPRARLARFPGAGHGLQYQCPEAFARTILKFLCEEDISKGAFQQ